MVAEYTFLNSNPVRRAMIPVHDDGITAVTVHGALSTSKTLKGFSEDIYLEP